MIHYHGGPITPETCAIRAWSGRHAFVSFAAPAQVKLAVRRRVPTLVLVRDPVDAAVSMAEAV